MTDLPINSPPKPNPSALRLAVSCGDCVFYANLRLPGAVAPCAGMGCPSSRAPCLKFSPNVFSEAVGEALDAKTLRDALNAVPDAAVASVAIALLEVARLRTIGFKLGQIVYFNVSGQVGTGREFIANYYRGRVMKLNTDGNVLIGGKGVTANIDPATVMTEKAWKLKRKELAIKKAVFDPRSPWTWERRDEALLIDPEYRPPWLDKEVSRYRATFLEAKTTRQTHDYDGPPVKRGRGRPRKDTKAPGNAKTVRTVSMAPSA